MIKLKNQIHLCDIYEDVEDCFKEDKPKYRKKDMKADFKSAHMSSVFLPESYDIYTYLTPLVLLFKTVFSEFRPIALFSPESF